MLTFDHGLVEQLSDILRENFGIASVVEANPDGKLWKPRLSGIAEPEEWKSYHLCANAHREVGDW